MINDNDLVVKQNKEKPFVVFFFGGQGAIHNKIAIELYNNEPIFKESIDTIDNIFKDKYYGFSMYEKLKSINNDDREGLYEQHLAHSILFMLQTSLFKLFKSYKTIPDLIFGISLGEIASAHCSGIIDLETACFLSYSRANLLSKTFTEYDSTLVSVDINANDFNNLYSKQFPNIEIACYIHDQCTTLGGKYSDFDKLFEIFKNDKVEYKLLPIASSFHTSSVESIKEQVEELQFSHSKPIIDHLSSVTCRPFEINNHPFDSYYLYNNIRKPCLLSQSVETIYKQQKQKQPNRQIIIVEISPQYSLTYFMEKTINTLSSLNNDINSNNRCISTLYKDDTTGGDLKTFKNVIDLINSYK